MHPAITVIQDSLAYARFPNPELRKLLNTHLNNLNEDIDASDYETGENIEESTVALTKAMNEIDSSMEELEAALVDGDIETDTVEEIEED